MSKVIKLNEGHRTLEEFLDESCGRAKEEATSIMLAYKSADGWVTGWFNADFELRQEGVAHMQIDIIDSVIKANIDKYIEYI